MYNLEIEKRFWTAVKVGEPDECWPYPRAGTGGYGQIAWKALGEGTIYAHRLAWQLSYQREIPEGLVIDHACHNADPTCLGGKSCKHRACCNPAHLEATTSSQNVKSAASARRGRRTHCIHGHEFTEKNTLIVNIKYRHCRECNRLRHNIHSVPVSYLR